jgi:hypothetical protein
MNMMKLIYKEVMKKYILKGKGQRRLIKALEMKLKKFRMK